MADKALRIFFYKDRQRVNVHSAGFIAAHESVLLLPGALLMFLVKRGELLAVTPGAYAPIDEYFAFKAAGAGVYLFMTRRTLEVDESH